MQLSFEKKKNSTKTNFYKKHSKNNDDQNLEKVENILKNNNVFYENIGFTQKDYFEIQKELKIDIKELYKINNQWYNNY